MINKHPNLTRIAVLVFLLCRVAAAQDITASVSTVGSGCGPQAQAPQLLSTRPVIGATVTAHVSHAGAGSVGWVVVSAPPPSPVSLGGGCTAYVDPFDHVVAGPIVMDAEGAWMLSFPLDVPPSWAGQELRLQVVSFAEDPDAASPIELVTNGLHWVFGSS